MGADRNEPRLGGRPILPHEARMGGETQELANANPLIEGYRSLDDNPGRSLVQARQALAASPNSSPALRLIGLALRATGQPGEAAEYEQRALKAALETAQLAAQEASLIAEAYNDANTLTEIARAEAAAAEAAGRFNEAVRS